MHFLLSSLLFAKTVLSDEEPFRFAFSSTYFGYDGPWQAVKVQVGSPGVNVHLYPGSIGPTQLIDPAVCNNIPEKECPAHNNLYSMRDSRLSGNVPQNGRALQVETDDHEMKIKNDKQYDTLKFFETDNSDFTAYNVSIVRATSWTVNFPGLDVPPTLGTLSLGAPDDYEIYTEGLIGGRDQRVSIPLNDMEMRRSVLSRTWGYHVGSTHLKQPASLVFGGYDRARLIGEPASYSFADDSYMKASLSSLELKVTIGEPPLKDFDKNNAFESKGPWNMKIDPTLPYMYLPETVCEEMGKHLPLNFDENLGLYLWKTSDPAYSIVNSSVALEFKFTPPSKKVNIIRVPLRLLHLTLTSPLVEKDTPYFPCRPTKSRQDYALGRAFLQAAYIGMNWHEEIFWMGQAAGPKMGVRDIVSLEKDVKSLKPTESNDWEKSWAPALKIVKKKEDGEVEVKEPEPLPSKTPDADDEGDSNTEDSNKDGEKGGEEDEKPGSKDSTSSKGKSIPWGAIIGAIIAGLLLIAAILGLLIYLRRKRQAARARLFEIDSEPDLLEDGGKSEWQSTHSTLSTHTLSRNNSMYDKASPVPAEYPPMPVDFPPKAYTYEMWSRPAAELDPTVSSKAYAVEVEAKVSRRWNAVELDTVEDRRLRAAELENSVDRVGAVEIGDTERPVELDGRDYVPREKGMGVGTV